MKRLSLRKFVTLFVLGLCWLTPVFGASTASDKLPEPIAAALKRHGFPTRGLSLYVHEIGQAEPVLSVSANVPRYPASTIKLLTTLVAVEELSPAWRWKTEAYVTQPLRDGRLAGDLYIKGYGDPYLVIEHFWRFLRALRAADLETIEGNLVLDQSHFAREPGGAADFDNQPLRAYNVLPHALLVNFQAVNFRFMPQASARRVQIIADPLPANVELENRVVLADSVCRGWASRLGMKLRHEKIKTRVIFSGTYDAGCGDNELFRVVSEPAPYTLGLFRSLWAELGGRFEGGVREGAVPADATLLHTAWSPPLADIIRSVNKYSNNVMARQLLLTLGAEQAGAPGTTDKGIQAVREWLKRRHLIFPELVLENGAGLSREEIISARHLGQVLLAGWRSPYMPEFVSSLPLAAMDGTLRRRFNSAALEGQMHLKTGSLRDVRSVAGYVLDRAGRRVAVVCLHNHARADTAAGEAVQEAVLQWVHERPAP
ncbi:MAG: D-alanyl-D-alanine carboxypeptidase/D-alanyl-D-alanine-endopeptidase [Candidatus Muproteobacteria bacterium RIFCSPHIGHO2_12_FULL_60_33]|uniref:D-alanyl-D-alanine carboxypeptidase/D-alanyl-D-alanine-endopeptidase n=1 Tax=Candidatus Muproteobacteria bacterium RIFCSPLOWO2_01_FULL_60_18 TaxID=1817768 RepID=A0A1F6U5A2_9PROT|nr:MAG: D-alanyl-D-alanine carboxypeptidase/D-alanyl-D-alanine-endopeptidase [Candidatus Muproteobacteria bacterium RIFCSPHIGHO2_01_60_12]OGI52520.1 MAG: D-alanyl-D-alanine carboxypeptidase/D-alanyl-D-alanine-endopeptidase [Candidatus Muproteobacteria bacterium RIFCSPLOWO2_01_FULL_60_18]OGI56167.1 MAG: D-alanyl-D-alanine carboxypeptidase/D-alanyl-D-alanine-endopeptidase [Candidatus Muproteobacteria bacterium RIFCSPHIGHO2_12_FULL_60_33]OGI59100.1 MAG: D-alanyl-D-alanine carboxypeptidase/D-alanyl-